MDPVVENTLLRQAIAGDVEAVSTLLEAHGPPVAATLSIAPRWQAVVSAEDVMQVTYLEAFLRIHDFTPSGPGAFAAWLRRIADNNLRDAIKELQRRKRPQPEQRVGAGGMGAGGADQSYVDLIGLLAGPGGTPSAAAATREATDFIEQALAKMPPDYENAIRLYELQARSIREVSGAMNRSEGAVKMLLARARDHLRECLGSQSRFFSQ